MKAGPHRAATFALRAARAGTPILAAAVCVLSLFGPVDEARAQQEASRTEHVVQKGETLSAIARKYGLDYRDLAKWNGISNPASLKVGQRLRLSAAKEGSVSEAPAAAPAPAPRRTQGAASAPGSASSPVSEAAAKAAPAEAAQAQQLQRLRSTTSELIVLLLQQGMITREKAETLMQDAGLGALPETAVSAPRSAPRASTAEGSAQAQPGPSVQDAQAAAVEPGVVRVPYIPEVVKNQIRDQLREEVIAQAKSERWAEPGTLPEWLDRISFDADLRFRYQDNLYASGNAPALLYNASTGSTLSNTTENETFYRVRARLGVNGKISDEWLGRFSITTGNGLNPISLNQSLANYFSGFGAQIDQAYLQYTPRDWASVWLGRMPKPYVSTEMIWWDDLNFDGVAARFKPRLNESLIGLLNVGGYLIQNTGSSPQTPNPETKYLLGAQAGAAWDITRKTRFNLATAYYDFRHIEGIPNPTLNSQIYNWTAPQFRQKGNSVFNIDNDGDATTNLFALASKFQVLDVTGSLDLAQFEPYVVRLGGAYVKNIGFDRGEIRNRTGLDIEPRTTGYQASILFGNAEVKLRNDWNVFAIYRRLGRDAVLDAFNDPDFYLGGTNYKGYQLGVRYAFADRAWVRLRWMSADELDGPPLGIDVLQLDVNARF
jgi:LysM repeat protein